MELQCCYIRTTIINIYAIIYKLKLLTGFYENNQTFTSMASVFKALANAISQDSFVMQLSHILASSQTLLPY